GDAQGGPGEGCPLPRLAGDLARPGPVVRVGPMPRGQARWDGRRARPHASSRLTVARTSGLQLEADDDELGDDADDDEGDHGPHDGGDLGEPTLLEGPLLDRLGAPVD